MRPIWTGPISFSLINIPIQLYTGSEEHPLTFDLLHKSDLSPIRYARVCLADGKEIPYQDIVKGYEYQKGEYVVLEEDDFNRIEKHKGKTIQVLQFVDADEIDSIFFEKPYYLAPGKGADTTKGDLIEYYRHIAPFLLPYLKDRPQVLHRFPNGIEKPGFYQKNISRGFPGWLSTTLVKHSDGDHRYLLIPNEKSLLFTVNLGCIELNPFSSRIQHIHCPDYMILDLDPEAIPFQKVIEIARAIHDFLESCEIPNYCKTSGATGLHIYIPLGAKYEYEQSRLFAQMIVEVMNEKMPEITSLIRNPKRRQHKVYLDYLQNNFGQTVAAPYSVRPRPGAPVSTPLEWSEVKEGLDPSQFTIKNIFERLSKKGDLFKPVLGKGIDMKRSLGKVG